MKQMLKQMLKNFWMGLSLRGKVITVVIALLVICFLGRGCGCGCSDNSDYDADNTDTVSDNIASDRNFSMYDVKLGDNHDTIMRKFEKAGLIKPGTNIILEHRKDRPKADYSWGYDSIIIDQEVMDVVNSMMDFRRFGVSLTAPLGSAELYFPDSESDVPFSITFSLPSDEMAKESDPFFNNSFYKKLCDKYGPPDVQKKEDGRCKFYAKWSTESEQLSFYIGCHSYMNCYGPEQYGYSIKMLDISVVEPFIQQATAKVNKKKSQEKNKRQDVLDKM